MDVGIITLLMYFMGMCAICCIGDLIIKIFPGDNEEDYEEDEEEAC